MTDFQEYEYRGVDSTLLGCAVKGANYFCFEPKIGNAITLCDFDAETNVFTGNKIDIFNIKQVSKKLASMLDENYFNQGLEYTKSISKAENAVANPYLNAKFKIIRKINFDIARLILKILHDLTWLKFTDLRANAANLVPILKDVWECLELIKPAAKSMLMIYYDSLEMKYPSTLSDGALQHDIDTNKLETEHQLDTIKNVTKKKTKKEHKNKN